MTAKRMTADELRTRLGWYTDRLKGLRDDAVRHGKRDGLVEASQVRYQTEADAFDCALHALFVNTKGEFGEDTSDGAQ